MSLDNEYITGHMRNGGRCVPPPPKKGEKMICQHCGKVMMPQDFSKDLNTRKREFKWHMHNKCYMDLLNFCDTQTMGLQMDKSRR